MSERLSHDKLRGAGVADRKQELHLGPVGPWMAIVTVHSLTTNHGRHSSAPYDVLFEVGVEWFGPPAVGMPFSLEPVQGRDAYNVTTYDDARRLAHLVRDAFAKGGDAPPDLRQLAGVLPPPTAESA